jgi:hypothetical protein
MPRMSGVCVVVRKMHYNPIGYIVLLAIMVDLVVYMLVVAVVGSIVVRMMMIMMIMIWVVGGRWQYDGPVVITFLYVPGIMLASGNKRNKNTTINQLTNAAAFALC